jgi:hypothetical protein
MARKSSDSRNFGLALGITALVIGGFVVYARWYSPDSAPAAATTDRLPERVAEISPPSTMPSSSGLPVIATVYECNGTAGRVLTDKPCADDAQVREVLAPNSMPAVPGTRSVPTPARRAPNREPLNGSGNRVVCSQIDSAIDRINDRMREKYSAHEGERLRVRLRELSEQRWDAKCRERGAASLLRPVRHDAVD